MTELAISAQAAIRMNGDTAELRIELLGVETPTRPVATVWQAVQQASGVIEAAIQAAGHGLKAGTYEGLIVTVQVRHRDLTIEELSRALRNVR